MSNYIVYRANQLWQTLPSEVKDIVKCEWPMRHFAVETINVSTWISSKFTSHVIFVVAVCIVLDIKVFQNNVNLIFNFPLNKTFNFSFAFNLCYSATVHHVKKS